jgi:hypothetical protein
MASSQTVDVTDKTIFRDNVVAMDVDNILIGWPTYEINFTPDTPGPLVGNLDIRLYLFLPFDIDTETHYAPERCFQTCQACR